MNSSRKDPVNFADLGNAQLIDVLRHPDPFVRVWTVRLLGDDTRPSMAIKSEMIDAIPRELESAFAVLWAAGTPDAGLIEVAVRFGSREAVPMAVRAIRRTDTAARDRSALLRLLAERRDPQGREIALTLVRDAASPGLRQEALAAVQAFGSDDVGRAVLDQALGTDDTWRNSCLTVLSSRKSWAVLVLEAVESGALSPHHVPRDVARALQSIAGDRGSLLHSIVDPNASVLPDFLAFALRLTGGPGEDQRQIIGFIHDENANGLAITDAASTKTAVAARDIVERTRLAVSLMPEGLLDSLTPAQLRNLFAWLQSNPKR